MMNLDILIILILGIFATIVIRFIIKIYLPLQSKKILIEDNLIKKIRTSCVMGKSYWWLSIHCSWPFTEIFIYKNFIIIKCLGYAQKFYYNKNSMIISKFIGGSNFQIKTEKGKIWIFLSNEEISLLKDLINNNSQ